MKKKGFTLIELVSVIVLLAVLALITVPVVSNIISSSQENARRKSMIEYANAVNLVQTEGNFQDVSIEELVNMKLNDNNVKCEITKYEELVNSPLLYNCNVGGNGNYCYINGNVYNGDTEDCESVKTIATTGKIPYLDPNISFTQIPTDTPYAQKKEISVVYPSLKIVDEPYYIRVSESVKLDNVIAICGTESSPSSCVDSTDKIIEANTWYRLSGDVKFDINKNLKVDAITGDTNKVTYIEDKIDTTAPSVNLILASTSSSISVIQKCVDDYSGIIKYEYKLDDGEYKEATSSGYVFGNLEQNKEYTVTLRCTNGSGMTNVNSSTISTKQIIKPSITQASQYIEKYEIAQNRTIRITYINTYVENAKNYIYSYEDVTVPSNVIEGVCGTNTLPSDCTSSSTTELKAKTWYKVKTETFDIIYTKDGNLRAMTTDEVNKSEFSDYSIMNVDSTAPIVNIASSISANRATVKASCSDSYSGITKYEFSKDGVNYEKTYESSDGTVTHVFTNLEEGKVYNFTARCTNGSGMINTASISQTPPPIPEITQLSQTIAGYEWAQNRVIRITYKNTNLTSPTYYFKSSVNATVASGVIVESCGTGTVPTTCSSSSTTSLSPNTWYRTNSTTVDVTYIQNGEIYSLTKDNDNISSTANYSIIKVDSATPSIASVSGASTTWSSSNRTFTLTNNSALSGITSAYYYVSNSTTKPSSSTTGTQCSSVTSCSVTTGKYVFFRIVNGAGTTSGWTSAYNNYVDTVTPSISSVSGASTTWSNSNRTFTLTNNSATSGISKAYYYVSNSTTKPSSSTAGTQCTSATSCSVPEGKYVFFRIVNGVGTTSGWTGAYNNYVDKISPGSTAITYNGGSNSCSWKNNYNLTFSSSDSLSGIAYYQVDYNNDGNSDGNLSSNWIPGNGWSSCTARFRAVDNAGNVGAWTDYQHIHMDTASPSTPSITYNGGSNSCAWQNNYNLTLSSSDNIAVSYYQIDYDNNGTVDATTSSNYIPANGIHYHYVRFRAVDYAGNVSGWTATQHIHMDTQVPGTTSISFAAGSNSCTWQNNQNINLTASENVGVSYYEIDWNGDGISDSTTGSNFTAWNGFSSCNVRFRAVDYAGNRGAWSSSIHIHKDTENPSHNNWWWGEVTTSVARLYIQTSDNASGINRVQCPTSTASGGYSNWYWYNATWDSSANAYRCDITPSTFGHYNQIYKTHLYIYDNAGNGGFYNETNVSIPSTCSYAIGQSWSYSSDTAFVVPCDGTYRLEAWGAQGGEITLYNHSIGGKGGYAAGNRSFTSGQTIYIVVGGKGSDGWAANGGYNGGGNGGSASDCAGAGGGGCTHFSFQSGLLQNTSSSNVLLVAGGGGGGGSHNITSGGDGGAGGTSNPSNQVNNNGGFGYGTSSKGPGGGGGCGYQGGSMGGGWWGGSGGSNYTGGLSNSSSNEGVQSGNGYAKITLVSY